MTVGSVTRAELIRDIEQNKETVDELLYGFLRSITTFSYSPLIGEIIDYGSLRYSLRERSYLIRLITEYYGVKCDEVEELLIAAELLNASTFFIDDILDNVIIRESKAAVWVKYGLRPTLNAHEVLRSLCYSLVTRFCAKPFIAKGQALAIIEEYNRIFSDVYLGQQLDIESEGARDYTEDDYFRMISLSSGSQFAGLCKIAAVAADAPQAEMDALSSAGLKFALCAQIRDDIIELLGEREVIGKELGVDLKAARPRLPILIYVNKTKKGIGDILKNGVSFFEVGNTALPVIKSVGERLRAEALRELRFAKGTRFYRYFEELLTTIVTY